MAGGQTGHLEDSQTALNSMLAVGQVRLSEFTIHYSGRAFQGYGRGSVFSITYIIRTSFLTGSIIYSPSRDLTNLQMNRVNLRAVLLGIEDRVVLRTVLSGRGDRVELRAVLLG